MNILPNNNEYASRNNKLVTFAENSPRHAAIVDLVREANRLRDMYEFASSEAASPHHLGTNALGYAWQAEALVQGAIFLSKK